MPKSTDRPAGDHRQRQHSHLAVWFISPHREYQAHKTVVTMRIKYRFLLVFVLVTIITAGVLVAAFSSYQTDIRTDAIETVERDAQTAGAVLESRLQQQQQTVSVAASNPNLLAAGESSQQAALEALVDDSAFTGASVVGRDGEMQAIAGVDSESREAVVGESYADREYVQRGLDGETYISDPFEAETGNQVVVMSAPIRENGEIVGSLNAALQLNETDLFEPFGDTSDEVAITVTSGETTLHSTADRFDDSLTETTTLSSTDWTVTAHYDSAAVSDEIRRLTAIQLLLSVLLIGAISGFGIWIYQTEIRHTERLHRRIDNIEARTYDDDIEFSGAAEWQTIGNALDRLSTTLARREQMLLVLNRFLRHNLRNELNVAVGYADEIRRETENPETSDRSERVSAAVSSVLSTADRVRLTEQLIDPAALEGRSIDLMALLREQIDEATESHPELSVTLDGPETLIVQGGQTLGFAIEELLSNVAAHSGSRPVARISVSTTVDGVSLRIADNGPGMHPEEAAIITGSKEITPLQHSSGLGLWLVNWIVRRHDGQLSIPDTTDGTTVVITLPRSDEPDTL